MVFFLSGAFAGEESHLCLPFLYSKNSRPEDGPKSGLMPKEKRRPITLSLCTMKRAPVNRPLPLDSISECADEIQRSGKQLDNEYYIQCNNRRNDKLASFQTSNPRSVLPTGW